MEEAKCETPKFDDDTANDNYDGNGDDDILDDNGENDDSE